MLAAEAVILHDEEKKTVSLNVFNIQFGCVLPMNAFVKGNMQPMLNTFKRQSNHAANILGGQKASAPKVHEEEGILKF